MELNNMNKKIHIIKGMLGINPKLVGEWLFAYRKLRYLPITPRLKSLIVSSNIAEHMTWYHSRDG